MDLNRVVEFNFTYALPDGAWLKDASGAVEWLHHSAINRHFGPRWFTEQRRRQGMFTGCWVSVGSEPCKT